MATANLSAQAQESNRLSARHSTAAESHTVDYLTYDGQRMTFDKLTYNLSLAEKFLYDAELEADAQGHDDLAEAFCEAREYIMDMMPGQPPVRRPDAATCGEGVRS